MFDQKIKKISLLSWKITTVIILFISGAIVLISKVRPSQMIKFAPDVAGDYNGLAEVFKKQNKLNEAIATYQSAIQLNSELIDSGLKLDPITNDIDQIEETGQLKSLAGSYFGLGEVLEKQDQLDKTIAADETAIELNQNWQIPIENQKRINISFNKANNLVSY